jgi:hypothetical protein
MELMAMGTKAAHDVTPLRREHPLGSIIAGLARRMKP